MKFLLNHTPTATHRVTVDEDQVTLEQAFTFTFGMAEKQELLWFLEAVRKDKSVRHTYTGDTYILDYDPAHGDLHLFQITRRATSRVISMGWSTARRLRLALTGETERLIKE